jgi:phosphoglycolate phosphatase-like HAD superfamily hydrolase
LDILVDLDGTLIDPKPGLIGSVQYALRKLGLAVPPPGTIRAMVATVRQVMLSRPKKRTPPKSSVNTGVAETTGTTATTSPTASALLRNCSDRALQMPAAKNHRWPLPPPSKGRPP